jgi:hypothetical protein
MFGELGDGVRVFEDTGTSENLVKGRRRTPGPGRGHAGRSGSFGGRDS